LRISFDTAAAISGVMPRDRPCKRVAGRLIRQQEVAERSDRERCDRSEGLRVMAVDDEPGDLVILEGDHGFLEELIERNVRQRHPRRDHLLGTVGGNARQPVARAGRRGLGQQIAQILEHIARASMV